MTAAPVLMLLVMVSPLDDPNNVVDAPDTTLEELEVIHGDEDAAVAITLQEAIQLALRANYNVRNAYIQRIAGRYGLYQAEDKFRPHISAVVSGGQVWATPPTVPNALQAAAGTTLTLAPHAEMLLPTGTLLSADLVQTVSNPPLYGTQENSQALTVTVMQPLIQNFGTTVNLASVRAAALQESINKQTLRNTLINTLQQVIFAYRQFTQDALQLAIAKHAVKRARDLLEINDQMVAAGRMARADLIQTQAEIANREVLAVSAESAYMRDQLALLNLLALSSDTRIVPVAELMPDELVPSLAEARSIAMDKRPEYFSAQLAKDIAAQNLIIAHNNRMWQLNAVAQHIRGGVVQDFSNALGEYVPGPAHSTFVGLTLSVPLLDVTLQQQVVNAEVTHREAEVTLEQITNTINVGVDTALRVLDLARRNYKLAQTARDLAEKKLANEREKLRAGRSSNFVVVSYVDDLVTAESGELAARIAYLNAVTTLQVQLGNLLDPWDVDIR